MNREIKFRAWHGKQMTTSGIMFNCSTSCLVTPDGAIMKLMQYTGVKDRNGKEIYEGDIVRFESENCDGKILEFGEVVYVAPEFKFKMLKQGIMNKGAKMSIWAEYQKEYAVVGNIYENPELL